jgi:hypothetical protein
MSVIRIEDIAHVRYAAPDLGRYAQPFWRTSAYRPVLKS